METQVNFRLAGGVNPLILVPAFLNASGPFECILDTGAGMSLLAPETARRLNVPITDVKDAYGAGGKISVSLGCLESLAVGEARRQGMRVAVSDEISRVGAVVGAEIHGDVGYDFLHRFQVGIDYTRGILSLRENEEAGDALGIPFTLAAPAKPLILLPVHVNGMGPFPFALDTGASTTTISPAIARRLGIPLQEAAPMTGAGGLIPASIGNIASLRVGMWEMSDLTVMISNFLEMLSGVCGTKLEGVLGYNFLRAFKVTIDYPKERFVLN